MVSKLINIAIGIVLIALVAAGGMLAYAYVKPAQPEGGAALERSLQQWKQAVEENPDNSLARANLGAIYLDMGKQQEAIKELRAALDQEPKSFTYMYQLALAYRQAGNPDEALELFKQSAELHPVGEKYAGYYQVALIYWEKADVAAAKDFVQRGLDDNDVIWNSHYLLGQIYERQGDKAKALEEYQLAARYNPNDPELQGAIKRVTT